MWISECVDNQRVIKIEIHIPKSEIHIPKSEMPAISIIIAVYKNIPALDLIFKSLARQSFQDFEAIVAEDNNALDMAIFVKNAAGKHLFPIKHVSQPDMGFRKNKALNQAIRISASHYLVFIDGDCVLHPQFLQQHYVHRSNHFALFGRRVMLSKSLTESLYETQDLNTLSIFNLIINRCKRIDCAFYLPFKKPVIQKETGIWGCNWSIHKSALIAINGYDEDYIKAGIGEDTDLEWRLFATGIQLKRIKHLAIQYHLYHVENYASTLENQQLLEEKKASGQVICMHGLHGFE
jgi:cellulose synthase/poly-beta-1,6-N-acetylglucosamine synthase-like glycosyltransferase